MRYLYLNIVFILFWKISIVCVSAQCTNRNEIYLEPFWTDRTYVPSLTDENFWVNDTNIFYTLDYEQKSNKKNKIDNRIKSYSINKLVEEATQGELLSRIQALDSLGKIDSARQIPFIEKILLSDTSWIIRKKCAETLKNLDAFDLKPTLIKALNNKNPYVRLECALTLAYLGEKEYSFNILKSIWNLNIGQKSACHTGFRNINTLKSVNFLRFAMNDTNSAVSLDAAIVMAQLKYYNEASSKIKEILHNKNYLIRIASMNALAYYIGGDNSYVLIKQMLNDNNLEVQQYCKAIMKKYFNITK